MKMTSQQGGIVSPQDAARIGHLETNMEMLDKRLNLIAMELRDLKHAADETATKRDVVSLGWKIRGSLAFWCIVLGLVVWYFSAGAALLAPLMRQWTG